MTLDRGPDHVRALLDELRAARDEFMAALADVEPGLLTAPGLVGEWSARDLLAHIGYWTGHAGEALHHAAEGRIQEFGEDELDVDERNAVVARVAADTDVATVRQREQAAYEALVTALEAAEPRWLEERTAYGDSLEEVLRDDGADHYREHTADVRAWFGGADEPDAEEGVDDEAAG